jgi:hypothetical protein
MRSRGERQSTDGRGSPPSFFARTCQTRTHLRHHKLQFTLPAAAAGQASRARNGPANRARDKCEALQPVPVALLAPGARDTSNYRLLPGQSHRAAWLHICHRSPRPSALVRGPWLLAQLRLVTRRWLHERTHARTQSVGRVGMGDAAGLAAVARSQAARSSIRRSIRHAVQRAPPPTMAIRSALDDLTTSCQLIIQAST